MFDSIDFFICCALNFALFIVNGVFWLMDYGPQYAIISVVCLLSSLICFDQILKGR